MVEGPSCWRKAERLKGLVGQRLVNAQQHKALLQCLDQIVTKVFAVGKELFIIFITHALRLHFGMSGGAEFCPAGSSHRAVSSSVVLMSQFIGGSFRVHGAQSTARVVDLLVVATAQAKADRDILSPVFNRGSVLALLKAGGDRMVCDIIMDQNILPGVGNVIKVEGLFSAAVYPLARADALSDMQWTSLLEGLRSCAQSWYASLRGRGRLIKRCYGHKFCPICKTKIALVREGTLQRITYFCPVCQRDSDATQVNGPTSGSIRTGMSRLAPRETGTAWSNATPPTALGPGIVGKSLGRQVTSPMCRCRKPCSLKQTFKEGPNRERHFFACPQRRCNFFEWLDKQLPKCQHGPARLRRVLKMGPNNGRYFAACPGRGDSGCKLFEWIDLREASCACYPATSHGEPLTVREPVLEFPKQWPHPPQKPGSSRLLHSNAVVVPSIEKPKSSLRWKSGLLSAKAPKRVASRVLLSSRGETAGTGVGDQTDPNHQVAMFPGTKRQRTVGAIDQPPFGRYGQLEGAGDEQVLQGSEPLREAVCPKERRRAKPETAIRQSTCSVVNGPRYDSEIISRDGGDLSRATSLLTHGADTQLDNETTRRGRPLPCANTESDEDLLEACLLFESQQVQHDCLHPHEAQLATAVVDLT